MSVLRQLNILSQQRIDVPHLRSIESGVAADFDAIIGRSVAGDRPLVVRGFSLGNTGGLATAITVSTADGIVYNLNATDSGSFLWVPADRGAEVLNPLTNSKVIGSWTPGAMNYVGLDLVRGADSSTTDLVQFLDPQTLLESPKQIPVGRTLDYRLVIGTLPFSSQSNLIPLATVSVLAEGNVFAVTDARQQLYRLGAGGDVPDANSSYAWPGGRTETGFAGGDKGISSQKEWHDAIMTRLWELGGGEHWYSATADRNVTLIWTGSAFSTGEYFEWVTSNLHWKGLRLVFDNSSGYYNDIQDQLTDSSGLTDLADGECLYVDLDRTENRTGGTALVAVKTALTTLGPGSPPGSRTILAYRSGSSVYTRGWRYAVGTTFTPATTTSLGVVRLNQTPGSPSTPYVVSIMSGGGVSVTNSGVTAAGNFSNSSSGAGGSFSSATGYGVYAESGSGRAGYFLTTGSVPAIEGYSDDGSGIYGVGGPSSEGVLGEALLIGGTSSTEGGKGVRGVGGEVQDGLNSTGGTGVQGVGGAVTGSPTGTVKGGIGVKGVGGADNYGVYGVGGVGGGGVYGVGGTGTGAGITGLGGVTNGIGVVGTCGGILGSGVLGYGMGTDYQGAGVAGIAQYLTPASSTIGGVGVFGIGSSLTPSGGSGSSGGKGIRGEGGHVTGGADSIGGSGVWGQGGSATGGTGTPVGGIGLEGLGGYPVGVGVKGKGGPPNGIGVLGYGDGVGAGVVGAGSDKNTGLRGYYSGGSFVFPTSQLDQRLNSVNGNAANNVWVVGDGGFISRWNGATWTTASSGVTTNLNSVWTLSSNDAWAVGDGGVALHWNGSAWSSPSFSGTTNRLNGVWASATNDVWAVGEVGTICRWNGSAWATVSSGVTTNLNAIWGLSSTEIYAVGNNGLLVIWNGSTWTKDPAPVIGTCNGIWGFSSNDIWIVGSDGVALNWDGGSWIETNIPSTAHLNSVWGSATNDVWAVGDGGAARHWNGSAWSTVSAGIYPLNCVWGFSGSDTWAIGGKESFGVVGTGAGTEVGVAADAGFEIGYTGARTRSIHITPHDFVYTAGGTGSRAYFGFYALSASGGASMEGVFKARIPAGATIIGCSALIYNSDGSGHVLDLELHSWGFNGDSALAEVGKSSMYYTASVPVGSLSWINLVPDALTPKLTVTEDGYVEGRFDIWSDNSNGIRLADFRISYTQTKILPAI
jgi:hypothetical protein